MRELDEAQIWFDAAVFTVEHAERGPEKYTVGIALTINGLIRANDALTLGFLGVVAKRDEDAPRLFGELIRQHKIDGKYAANREMLTEAVSVKSDYTYKGVEAGKNDAGRWIRRLREYIRVVHEILGI